MQPAHKPGDSPYTRAMREARYAKGLSCERVAQEIAMVFPRTVGVTGKTIARLETDTEAHASPIQVAMCARVYGVPLATLVSTRKVGEVMTIIREMLPTLADVDGSTDPDTGRLLQQCADLDFHLVTGEMSCIGQG